MRGAAALVAVLALEQAGLANAALTCFGPVVEPGALTFTVRQAGVPITGSFTDFDAEICLDLESSPTRGHISVRVRTAAVDAMFPELEAALRGPQFLDSQRWPEATFESDAVERVAEDRYTVAGRLTIRDITRSIEATVRWQAPSGGDGPRLIGATTIDRLDYDVGLGEWRDTRWLGADVTLDFSITLTQLGAE